MTSASAVPVLGAMFFGTTSDEKTSFALLDRFVEAGGRTIDTANCYSFWTSETGHGGQSEALLGRWLAANPGLRDELVIATKVGAEPVDAAPGTPAGVEGLSAEVIHREARRSLDRMGIDQIDLYWAHVEDRSVDLAETVQAFGELVEGGVVRRLGASNHPAWRLERARRIAADLGVEPWTALQPTTSYLRPRPDAEVEGKGHRFGFLDDETVDYVTEHPEIEIWAYSPLIRGSYDRDDRPFPEAYDHPGTQRRLVALKAVAERLGARPSQVVLAWLMGRTPQIRPIVGVSTLEQLDLAMGATRLDLDEDLRRALDAAR